MTGAGFLRRHKGGDGSTASPDELGLSRLRKRGGVFRQWTRDGLGQRDTKVSCTLDTGVAGTPLGSSPAGVGRLRVALHLTCGLQAQVDERRGAGARISGQSVDRGSQGAGCCEQAGLGPAKLSVCSEQVGGRG